MSKPTDKAKAGTKDGKVSTTGQSVPVTAEHLAHFVANQDDFGLELFVYSTARNLGFAVTHSGTYTDRTTNQTRQYDIRASIIIDKKVVVEIPIECKCLQNKGPILLSRIPRITAESYHEEIKHNHFLDGSGASPYPKHLAVIRRTGTNSLYIPNTLVAKSITQIKVNDRDEFTSSSKEVFSKWSQALASANDFIKSTMDLKRDKDKYDATFTIIIPALVVSDGTLWVADYAENGTLLHKPYQVDEATMFVGETYDVGGRFDFQISHLHIFTKSGIARFLTDLKDNEEVRRRYTSNSASQFDA